MLVQVGEGAEVDQLPPSVARRRLISQAEQASAVSEFLTCPWCRGARPAPPDQVNADRPRCVAAGMNCFSTRENPTDSWEARYKEQHERRSFWVCWLSVCWLGGEGAGRDHHARFQSGSPVAAAHVPMEEGSPAAYVIMLARPSPGQLSVQRWPTRRRRLCGVATMVRSMVLLRWTASCECRSGPRGYFAAEHRF